MDKEHIAFKMETNILASGMTQKCMVKEHIIFTMEQNLMAFIVLITDMGKV